jgi:hypothetical protein
MLPFLLNTIRFETRIMREPSKLIENVPQAEQE